MTYIYEAYYYGLCYLKNLWHTSLPEDLWAKALSVRQNLSESQQPDLILPQLFVDLTPHDAVITEALLLAMLIYEDQSIESSPVKEALGKMILTHGEAWQTVYAVFWQSEEMYENKGCEIHIRLRTTNDKND